MNRMIAALMAVFAGLFLAQVLNMDSAVAQQREQARELERIVVVAPRIVREESPLRRVITVEKDATVDFSDLDIRQTMHFMQLEQRIQSAASQICEDLQEQFPRGRPAKATCIERAVADAMDEVRSILHQLTQR
ncbi:UrcA family protein [Natronospira bacteriovora]|uniref:UrcA family protein n=1 Tax=Natronospira bacteriovora TaxID=3069753 RepID=A0ABU0W3M0_9GAMM|nr:UrcA family protein [Natronospira sp. AB-CW4]MDQ2068619.1 UrcA family protein [Natronospira sp. AB-CW4]